MRINEYSQQQICDNFATHRNIEISEPFVNEIKSKVPEKEAVEGIRKNQITEKPRIAFLFRKLKEHHNSLSHQFDLELERPYSDTKQMLAFTNHLRELKGSYLQKLEEHFFVKKASDAPEVYTLLHPPPPPSITSPRDMPATVEGKSAIASSSELWRE